MTGLKDENNDKLGEESAMSLIADMTEVAIDGEVAEPVEVDKASEAVNGDEVAVDAP